MYMVWKPDYNHLKLLVNLIFIIQLVFLLDKGMQAAYLSW